ncbi:MAG: glycosyltransferase family 2 protein [Candidatus Woesearchaeota archaeon]|nr:MAG: glycosyltransferase family 2 protein [Candidatus Woesearchaeota archaeon]
MKTIAIIPAYNEEKNIERVIEGTKKYVNYTIVVNDGSIDKTVEKARKADLVLTHLVNMGKGLALKTGIEAAIQKKTDVIITIDADMQHDPDDIPRLLKEIKRGSDIVIGSRTIDKEMPFVLKFGNWFLHNSFKKLFKVNIKDTQSGFRAFKSSIYPQLKWASEGYAVETEMLINLNKYNLEYKEIPIKAVYTDKYKGTTPVDGIKIFLSMLLWKLKN